jgi:hypothetical protein
MANTIMMLDQDYTMNSEIKMMELQQKGGFQEVGMDVTFGIQHRSIRAKPYHSTMKPLATPGWNRPENLTSAPMSSSML